SAISKYESNYASFIARALHLDHPCRPAAKLSGGSLTCSSGQGSSASNHEVLSVTNARASLLYCRNHGEDYGAVLGAANMVQNKDLAKKWLRPAVPYHNPDALPKARTRYTRRLRLILNSGLSTTFVRPCFAFGAHLVRRFQDGETSNTN